MNPRLRSCGVTEGIRDEVFGQTEDDAGAIQNVETSYNLNISLCACFLVSFCNLEPWRVPSRAEATQTWTRELASRGGADTCAVVDVGELDCFVTVWRRVIGVVMRTACHSAVGDYTRHAYYAIMFTCENNNHRPSLLSMRSFAALQT